MPRQLVECVPNFSEGRDPSKIDAIVQAILAVPEVALLDRESDADHNRCVLTFVGPPAAVAEAAFRSVEKAVALIDLTQHQGAHPRIGAADVVPFIPIEGVTLEECVKLAERVGNEIWSKLQVPVYFYEAAAKRPERTNLENIRRGQFEALVKEIGAVPERLPDCGDRCHPTAGATVVGARKFLIAYNVNLGTPDLAIAKKIAKTIRFSSGGFRYVKSMGVMLGSRNLAQVSINLTDFEQTPMHLVYETVRREAERYGVPVVGSEIVGLIPKKSLELSAEYFLRFENFRPELVLEHRVADAMASRGGLPEFLDALAAPTATPGGGSASAAAAAMAAALGSMVTRMSKQDAAAFEDDRHYFTEAVDRDAAAFQLVMAAYKRPKDERAPFIEEALHGAAEVPLQVYERATLMQARLDALVIPARFGSDLAVAKALTVAAKAGVLENVRINLDSITDEAFKAAVEARLKR
ncbi:MAG TPA: glutamate formimidoyltransferase [Candidatus Sulfopaludibacter sp.]|jgi:glutamate formiminotransferase|nr:glutamate formimidoyltransferase [Candidatus Sulfopaludibacter sp.]